MSDTSRWRSAQPIVHRAAVGRALVLIAAGMLCGCAIRPALVDLYVKHRWAELPSVNALVLDADDWGVSIDSIGYVQGPHRAAPPLAAMRDVAGFVVPVRIETVSFVAPDAEAGACAEHTFVMFSAALQRVGRRHAERYRGVPLPAVHLHVAAPGHGMRQWRSSRGPGFTSTILHLAVPALPDPRRCLVDAPFWVADTVATIVHELQHVVAFQRPAGRPEALVDEFVASLVETCARHVVLGRLPGELIVGFRFGPDAVIAVLHRWQEGRLQTSMAGKFLAEAVRRAALGTADIEGDRGDDLLQLCDSAERAYTMPGDEADVASWLRRPSNTQ